MSSNLITHKKTIWLLHTGILLGGCIFLLNYYSLPTDTYYFYFGSFLAFVTLYLFSSVCFTSKKTKATLKTIYLIICSILIQVACLHADNIHSYGPLVADTFHALYQTSFTEIIGYIYQYMSWPTVAISIAWICLAAVTGIFLAPVSIKRHSLAVILATGFATGITLIFSGKNDFTSLINEASAYNNTLSEFSDSRQNILESPQFSNISSDFEGNIIIVLGESSTRHHFGIYNYVRNTTPLLSEIKHELIIFTDIISTHSHTIPSLTDALTYNKRSERRNARELADIINVAKKAQFHTAWLSNQNAVGIWDNLVSAIGYQADTVKYHDPTSGKQWQRSVFDIELVNSTKKLLSSHNREKNLIFLHLMATHFPYCNVVPEEFAQDFVNYDNVKIDSSVIGNYLASANKNKGMIGPRALTHAYDCYDRSVRYVDFTLRELIESVRTQKRPTLIVYLSDHGEAPILGTGHDSRKHSHFHVEIPFFVWANDAYRELYSSKIQSMIENTSEPGSLLDFSYYLTDIAMIKGISTVDNRSIFSAKYEPFTRKTLHETIGYDVFDDKADYSERTRANLNFIKSNYGSEHSEKVWAHRVNTIGAMIESKELFSGLEIDLVFDSEKLQFFVYHPPTPNVGLNLQTHLRQDNGKTRYWFDWKNANVKNFKPALERLETLDKIYNIKNRVILESGTLDKSFSVFQKNGWHTSYYLPTEKVLDCIKECSKAELTSLARKLLQHRRENGYDTVSFDYRLLEFYDSYLDEILRKNKVKVYIWNLGVNVSDRNAPKKLKELINHPRVGVVLVNFPSPFDR